MHRLADWLLLGAVTLALGAGLGAAGLPSSYLFGALLAGLLAALRFPGRLEVPDRVFVAAQAVTGVTLGAYLEPDSLEAVAGSWLPVLLVSAGTLALSVAAGKLLARTTDCDETTASLGLVAGGATGIVAMADELGGDGRLVAFMQYARVLIVVLITPLVAAVAFPGHSSATAAATETPLLGEPSWWAITAAVAVAGAAAGALVRLPNPWILGPLLVSGAATLVAPSGTFEVPELLREAAFIGIGAQVGLRFTPDTLREVGRLLGPVLVSIAGLIAGCFGLAVLLHLTADVSLADAYLATTPGGFYAVAAIAFGANGDTTFIVAVQGLRVLVMVLLAPAVVRRLNRRA
ncbi:MAG TPA: AbrB family transcriptional regulator [Thermoleophilaceae bacterium]|nr:AbrB family transcriptional regulator [Thermoleophilaceae bacterium]